MSENIQIKKWVERGNMLVNTESLDIDDPDHVYNQVKAQGVNPEDYGIEHPYEREFKDKSRGELVQEIIELKKQILSCSRYCPYSA